MRNSCLPQIVKWLEYFVVEDFRYRSHPNAEGVYTFRGAYLRQAYTDYAASESRVTDAAFGRLMKKMTNTRFPRTVYARTGMREGLCGF